MGSRSWRSSSEQLQWQNADLQRKLKDSEQRSTLWARRAGAAEARVPIQATSASLPCPTGLFAAGQGPALSSAAKAGLRGTTERLIGSQADPMGRSLGSQADFLGTSEPLIGSLPVTMGRPAAAIGKSSKSMDSAGVGAEENPTLLQGRAAPGQQGDDDEKDHEEACALALLQEALSAAPAKAKARMAARRSTIVDDGMTIDATHMQQDDESVLSAAAQLECAKFSNRQLSSLQQRIADYEKQNGLAALQGLSFMQSLSAGNDGKPSSVDDPVSPLKQRIAEYSAQHIMCESPRSPSSPRTHNRIGHSSRTNH